MAVNTTTTRQADGNAFMPVSDPIQEAYLQDQEANETPTWAPAAIESATVKYRFRTKPGHRLPILLIGECPPEAYDADQRTKFDKVWTRSFGAEKVKRARALVNRLGDRRIVFTPVSGKFEAYYDTDDPQIAKYIREKIAAGAFPGVYEEVAPMEVTVNGRTIKVVPADETSRQDAAEALAG